MATTQKRSRSAAGSGTSAADRKTTAARKTPAAKATIGKRAGAVAGKRAAASGVAVKRTKDAKVASQRSAAIKAGATAFPARPHGAAKTPATAPRGTRKKAAGTTDPFALLRKLVLGALDDLKARDVIELDVRDKTSVTDLLVIASGTSSRHVKSIADEVVKKVKQSGVMPLGVEGEDDAEWVLVDLGDIVVHVMLPRSRDFYALERLWGVGDEDERPAALSG